MLMLENTMIQEMTFDEIELVDGGSKASRKAGYDLGVLIIDVLVIIF